MKKGKQKKGMNPVVAVLFLVVSGGVAARQLLGPAGLGDALPSLVGGGGADAMPLGSEETGGEKAAEPVQWTDLLAVHGSFDRTKAVRVAFSTLAEASAVAAAPGGETMSVDATRWRGDDPPALRLGVVMISAGSRRAVLGGQIVGIGDAVATGKVVAIEAGTVVLRWQDKNLTYDLDDAQPREFRAEHLRRQAEAQESTPATELKENQEERK